MAQSLSALSFLFRAVKDVSFGMEVELHLHPIYST
jgi:hypothetical protein